MRACGAPKNSQLRPVAPVCARSCTKPRNGATPVPGPIIRMSRAPSFGRRKRSFGSMKTRSRVAFGQPGEQVRRGAPARLALDLVLDVGDGEMRLVADLERRGRDRVEARRERPQRGDERIGLPRRRVRAQQVDPLRGVQQPRRVRFAPRREQRIERRRTRTLGMPRQQRTRQARDLAFAQQPVAQRQRAALGFDGAIAVERQPLQDLLDQRRRVRRPDPQRIAGLVGEARALERQFDVPDVARRAARGDALHRQYRRMERRVAPVRGRRGRADRRHRGARGRRHQFARGGLHRLDPRRGDFIDVEVRIAARQPALRAQRLQPCIQPAPDLAELRIARIAEPQHAEAQAFEAGRARTQQVFDETAGVVRRLAVALRADHHEQQRFRLQFAQRVVGRVDATDVEPGGFQHHRYALRGAPCVAGLAAEDHGEARRGGRRRVDGARRGVLLRAGQSGRVARQPPQRIAAEAVREPVEQVDAAVGQRGGQGNGGHGATGASRLCSVAPCRLARKGQAGMSSCPGWRSMPRHVVMPAAPFLPPTTPATLPARRFRRTAPVSFPTPAFDDADLAAGIARHNRRVRRKTVPPMPLPTLSHLDRLEAESIHILREVAAEFRNPVMLYSVGKDSSVLLHLLVKAFAPGAAADPDAACRHHLEVPRNDRVPRSPRGGNRRRAARAHQPGRPRAGRRPGDAWRHACIPTS